ncbi:MAG: hypothetical protein ACE5JM_06065 [Armatimonadota bacterium]
MRLRNAIMVLVLVVLVSASASAYVKEGTARGTVVAVGEGRLVLQTDEGGQMTVEVATVQDGDRRIKDHGQLAQLKTIKQGQKLEVKWGQDHTGHYSIVQVAAATPAQEQPRNGVARGQVITTGEGRIVIGLVDGGQMTLEPHWIRRRGKFVRDPYQVLFAKALKPGDEIVAIWDLDEGSHFVFRGISKTDPSGHALAIALMQAELRETYQQINQLQNQIQQLQTMIRNMSRSADR